MSNCAIVGINWGDEGKGRMVDLIARDYDIVCRYQGGNNAGHTIVNEYGKFALHLIPSGICLPGVVNVLGNGVVIDLESLCGEIEALQNAGVPITPENFKISERATIVFPYHRALDGLEEARLKDKKYGSTLRGIAPVYSDKYQKKTIMMGELLYPAYLEKRLASILEWKNLTLTGVYGAEPVTMDELKAWMDNYCEKIKPFICDTGVYLRKAQAEGKKILFEAQLGALRDLDIFSALSQRMVHTFSTVRGVCTALVIITMFGSMLLTNDTALLTFLPLGWFVLSVTGQEKHAALLFILQNCAANLCGMITPFGSPQNLYLFNYYGIPAGTFFSVMLPPFILSTVLILLCCLAFPKDQLCVPEAQAAVDSRQAAVYGGLFCLAVAMVLRLVPYVLGLTVIVLALWLLDRHALKTVDWGLLATFAAFFTFSGNLARMEPVRVLFARLLSHGTMLVSALTCQIISNVPAAILLSRFTQDARALLVGVNVGGAGTLVASLASLITFREYTHHVPNGGKQFLFLFSGISFAFLTILLAAMSFLNG